MIKTNDHQETIKSRPAINWDFRKADDWNWMNPQNTYYEDICKDECCKRKSKKAP